MVAALAWLSRNPEAGARNGPEVRQEGGGWEGRGRGSGCCDSKSTDLLQVHFLGLALTLLNQNAWAGSRNLCVPRLQVMLMPAKVRSLCSRSWPLNV